MNILGDTIKSHDDSHRHDKSNSYFATICPCCIRALLYSGENTKALASWWKWVIAIRVSFSNSPICSMNQQF